MKKIMSIAALAMGLLVLVHAAGPAAAAYCAKRSEIVERLAAQYSETPINLGVVGNATMLEIFTSPEGTFTILITRADGISCLLAAGTAWQASPGTKKQGA